MFKQYLITAVIIITLSELSMAIHARADTLEPFGNTLDSDTYGYTLSDHIFTIESIDRVDTYNMPRMESNPLPEATIADHTAYTPSTTDTHVDHHIDRSTKSK